MRDVQILTFCDPCTGENPDAHTPATETTTITLNGTKPRQLDFCARHAQALLAPIAALLAAHGRHPDAPLPAPRPSNLVRTGKPGSVLSGLSGHGATGNGAGPKRWTCPLCSTDLARPSAAPHVRSKHLAGVRLPKPPTRCPTCREPFDSPQGCAAHRARVHGFDAAGELVELARQHEKASS